MTQPIDETVRDLLNLLAKAEVEGFDPELEQALMDMRPALEARTGQSEVERAAVARDAEALAEELLEFEDMDQETCNALPGFDLCGSHWCEACGCLVDKLARARAALSSVGKGG